jgi:hypothetical protein
VQEQARDILAEADENARALKRGAIATQRAGAPTRAGSQKKGLTASMRLQGLFCCPSLGQHGSERRDAQGAYALRLGVGIAAWSGRSSSKTRTRGFIE